MGLGPTSDPVRIRRTEVFKQNKWPNVLPMVLLGRPWACHYTVIAAGFAMTWQGLIGLVGFCTKGRCPLERTKETIGNYLSLSLQFASL